MYWLLAGGILCCIHASYSAMLSIRALYIVGLNSTEFPNLTLYEMVDELELYHYDSNNMSFIPQYEWLKNIEDQQFWTFQNNLLYYLKDLSNNAMKTVMGLFNQTSGVHFLQGMAGCDINGSSFAVLGYDGNDLLLFNTTSLKCTAAQQEVKVLEDICNVPLISVQFLEAVCFGLLQQITIFGAKTLNKQVKPEAFLVQRMPTEVTCFVTGFLPGEINVTWIRDDGKQVESTSGEILPNGDETYQIRINLTVSSMDLQKYSYSCVVKHSSLTKNLIVTWNHKESDSSTGIIIGVAIAIVLLIIVAIIVLIIWKRRQNATIGEEAVTYVRDFTSKFKDRLTFSSFSSSSSISSQT